MDEGLSGSDRRRGDGEARYSIAEAQAREALRRVRVRDPDWEPTPSLIETAEGAIRAREGELAEASARLRELLRDAIPNTNPDWGVNRLRKELTRRNLEYQGPTRDPGILMKNR